MAPLNNLTQFNSAGK